LQKLPSAEGFAPDPLASGGCQNPFPLRNPGYTTGLTLIRKMIECHSLNFELPKIMVTFNKSSTYLTKNEKEFFFQKK